MFTPRGELKEGIFELLQSNEKLVQLQEAASKEELLDIINRFLPGITFEELQDSVIIIQSYLEEQKQKKISEENSNYSGRLLRNKVEIMLEERPESCENILEFYKKLQIMH